MPNHSNFADPFYSGDNSTYAPQPLHKDASLIAIGPLFATLWQRKFIIATVTFIFVGLTLLYISIIPSTYTAKGVIVIDPRQVQVLDSAGVLSGIGANSAAISSQVEIIQSRTLVHEVFLEQGYASDPEFAKPRLLSRIFGFISPTKPVTEAKIFNNFWKRLEVKRQGLTYVLTVTFKSQDRQKSAKIVNAIIARYLTSQVNEKSGANAEVSVLLSAQVEGLRNQLSAKEAAVENFKESHNILNVGVGQTLLQSQIQQLSAQLVVAREQARAANNRHLQVASIRANSDPLPSLFEFLTDTSSTSLRANYTASSMALSSLQASFGPRHPNITVATAELTRLDNLIRNEVKTVLQQISKENDLAQTNVENTETALETMSNQNAVSNQDEVELRHLIRQADATRQVLEQLINREQETDQLENLQRSDARVISQAVAPILATWPKATLLLAIASFFGLILGSAIALYLGPKTPRQPHAQNHTQGFQSDTQYAYPAKQQHQNTPYQAPFYQEDVYAQHQAMSEQQPTHHQNIHSQNQHFANSDVTQTMYHSSESPPENVVGTSIPAHAHEHMTAPTSAPAQAPNHAPASQEPQVSRKIWARRAAGEPYNSPTNARTPYTQNSNASQPVRPNISHDNSRPQSFVAELKRRRNHHQSS